MRFAPAFAALALLALSPPSASAKSQIWMWCEGAPGTGPDHQILGCTAAIQSGKESARNMAVAFNNRANAYTAKGDYDRAIADYGLAIKLFPTYVEAIYNRGLAHGLKGAYVAAIQDFDQVIDMVPTAADAFNSRCWTRARAGEDLDEALEDCDTALTLRPNDPATLDARGFVRFRMGDYDEAIDDCSAALAGDPSFASSLFVRGLAKLQNGDTAGNADINAAKAIDRNVQKEYAGYGVRAP
jgi:tetratricopeptide (TPR) repeat protein